jgi:hypothetical protein
MMICCGTVAAGSVGCAEVAGALVADAGALVDAGGVVVSGALGVVGCCGAVVVDALPWFGEHCACRTSGSG